MKEWLNPELVDRDGIRSAVRRWPTDRLVAHPVSNDVNRPENDQEDLLKPIGNGSEA